MNKTGRVSIASVDDNRFAEQQQGLTELINSDQTVTISISKGSVFSGAGGFDDRTGAVRIDPDTGKFTYQHEERNPKYNGVLSYLFSNENPTTISLVKYSPEDVMAHELLGHGLDWVRGEITKAGAELRAVWRANKVRTLLNKPTRSLRDPSIGSK